MVGKILGKPEGREGIWLISADEACKLIEAVPGDMVHNFLTSPDSAVFLGADWTKKQACDLVCRSDMRCGLIFKSRPTGMHQLVAINEEKRWSFDIGEIDECRMEEIQ